MRVRAVLPALCAIGIAATVGWTLAGVGAGVGVGESLPSTETLFGLSEPSAAESSGGIPVHIDSSPAGAQVQIDGKSFGLDKTPLDVRLSAGQHTLNLQHPEALDDERTIQVADIATTIDVALWRRRPDVVAVRPVFPGASLIDARFLNDGQVALLVGLPTFAGATDNARELWRLDPGTGQLSRVEIRKTGASATTMVLAPDGDQVAYVTPSSSPAVTVTGWSTRPSGRTATPRETEPESVWLWRLDGTQPPRRIFGLPSASAPATSSNAEHVSGLVWMPDGSQLVAITRQTGPPVRSRLFLLNVPPPGVTDSQLAADELVLLPAEVLPDSAVPDPRGRWLALVTRAAVAPAGQNLLNLCVLELKPAGTFRDVADLGSGTPSVATPIAWPPAAAASALERLIFVAPAPPAISGNGGVFGIFGALRPSAPPSGLYMADLEASGLQDAQPRRLGSSTNHFGLVWRDQTALFGFGRQSDGTLALDSIDSTTGAVKDLGVRLPAGTAQGRTGLSVRWDALHGYALLLALAADGWVVRGKCWRRSAPGLAGVVPLAERAGRPGALRKEFRMLFCSHTRAVTLVLIVISVAVALASPVPALAQSTASPAGDGSGGNTCFLGVICQNPATWLQQTITNILTDFLSGLANDFGGAIVGFINQVNFLTRTPENLSYNNDLVKQYATATQMLADGLLTVVVLVRGYNVMLRPYLGATYAGALETLPRLLLGGILINTAAWWCRLAIDVNNAACGVFGAPNVADVVSTMLRVILDPTHISGLLMLLVATIMTILLLIQQLMRLALVDVLLILAPLAAVLWILPQSQGWGRLWGRLFIGTVFAQAVQVLTLRLGFNLTTGLPPLSISGLLQPLLGIAVLALVLKIPGLMGGGGAGGNIVASLVGTAAGAAVGSGVGVAVRGALGASATRAGRRA